jgi:hypothetical protein
MDEQNNSLCASAASANLAILEKLQGLWMARAIQVAVRLGLPDLLGSGPKSLSELALATDSSEETLYRLLRCLKHLGVISEISPEFFDGTPLSEGLQRDRSDSLYWL